MIYEWLKELSWPVAFVIAPMCLIWAVNIRSIGFGLIVVGVGVSISIYLIYFGVTA